MRALSANGGTFPEYMGSWIDPSAICLIEIIMQTRAIIPSKRSEESKRNKSTLL